VEYSFIELDSDNHNGFTRAGVPFTLRDHDLDVQSVTARLNFQRYRDENGAPAPLFWRAANAAPRIWAD